MKPSRYTFLIVPDNDGDSRRFSISRNGTLFIGIFLGIIVVAIVFSYTFLIPMASDYKRMDFRYNEVIGERIEVLELYRDLERMKQMEIVVQKALGMDLGESDSTDSGLSKMMDDYPIKLTYLDNVPSLLPAAGVLTQDMIVSNEEDIREHYGVDIAVPQGEPVMASASGQVIFSGWTTELGNLVIIYHGNEFFTYYGHNELILVKPYEKVKRGDVISTSGNSGISSGPHLHFEIWKDGEPVDPLLYFPELNKSNISVKEIMAKNDYKDVHTMIGTDAVIQGNITCQGGVAVYGKVFGDVISEGPVRIARGGEVHGNVQANDSQIGGMVDGNVRVENRAVLGAECNLKGDLIYRTLVIEEGAQFQGHCVMVDNEKPANEDS